MNARITKRPQSGSAPTAHVSMPVIGHVRIGEKRISATGKEYPVSLDYFKADATNAAYADQFRQRFGEKPTSLPIVFASDDLSEVCRHYFELRGKDGKRLAHGDGETFKVATKQGQMVQDVEWTPAQIAKQYGDAAAFMNELEKQAGGPWREKLTLRFVLVGIPVIGCWQFDTHGDDTTIPQIVGQIDAVMAAAGRLSGIPFDLQVEKVKSDKAGDTRHYPIVKLVCNLSVESVESLRTLPHMAGFGLLSNERIERLSAGDEPMARLGTGEPEAAPADPFQPDAVEVQYLEDEAEMTNAQRFMSEYEPRTVNDLNDIYQAVKRSDLNDEEKKEAGAILLQLANRIGYGFDKAKGFVALTTRPA